MHRQPSELPSECYVYGAGTFGHRLAESVASVGVRVNAMIDLRSPTGSTTASIEDPRAPGLDREMPVLLGICNPEVDLRGLRGELQDLGYRDVWSPVEAAFALGDTGAQLNCYWLTGDRRIYAEAETAIDAGRDLLDDKRSVENFDAILRYRMTGDIDELPAVDDVRRQYLGDGLGIFNGAVRLLDAGAFTGDTVRAFEAANVGLEAVISLEPDSENFEALVTTLSGSSIQSLALPLALSERTQIMTFAAATGASARLSESGQTVVAAVAGDDLLHGWQPSHIKMDIEGAEPGALKGLRRTLERCTPVLAISAYHEPDHLWSLVHWIDDLRLGYDFYLRCYGHQTFDTVLYARPARLSEVEV